MAETKDGYDTLFQVSTLNALMQGLYDGTVRVDTFLQYGDTGLGTVDRLDGEMITLDGVVYQVKSDGSVHEVSDDETLPFAVITPFNADISETVDSNISNIEELSAYLSNLGSVAENPNRIYVAKIKGEFTAVKTRSVAEQEKPYPPLSEVTQNQATFEFNDVEGTIVAVYFPNYLSYINMSGWHLHFLSADKTQGGHVLQVNPASATLELDITDGFQMFMPDTTDYAEADLSTDMSEEINAAER